MFTKKQSHFPTFSCQIHVHFHKVDLGEKAFIGNSTQQEAIELIKAHLSFCERLTKTQLHRQEYKRSNVLLE